MKTFLPQVAEGWVDRGRIREPLEQSIHSHRRLILVSAMAGSGKSTLLATWAAASHLPFAWVSLDTRDNAFHLFWSYLIAAVQRAVPTFGQALLTKLLSPQPPENEIILFEYIEQVAQLPDRLVLVLDDYHLIESPVVHESMVYLVEHLPPTLLLVLCTRSDPPMPLSRWRVRGYLAEIRAEHLRFNQEEATGLLRGSLRLPLDDEDVTQLEASTEGWAAGLQMAGLALQNLTTGQGTVSSNDRAAQKSFIARFSANHQYVFEYLTSEVLNQQPPELHAFLLQTSILKKLSGPLCQAVTGEPDSADILRRLCQKNLFIVPLDPEGVWYRYHHLFADLLKVRLARQGAEVTAQLHIRAAIWFAQSSSIEDALYHALEARDYGYAAEIVNSNWRLATDRGWPNVALGWLEALPEEIVKANPHLSLAAACTQWLRGKAEETQRHCENALQSYERWIAANGIDPYDIENETIPSQATSMQALVAVRRGRLDEAVGLSRKAIETADDRVPISVGLAYQALATALRDLGEFEEAIQAYRTAIPAFRKTGNRITVTNSSFNLGRLLMVQGRLNEAERFFHEALSWAGQVQFTPADSILQVYLGEIAYERNQLGQAEALLSQPWSQVRASGYLELLKNGSMLKARLLNAAGAPDEAIRLLKETVEAVTRTDARGLLHEIQSVLARYQAEAGQIPEALAWAQTLPPQVGDHLPGLSTGFQLINLAHVHLVVGNVDAVLAICAHFTELAQVSGSRYWLIETLLLQALALAKAGNDSQAQAVFLQVLALAQPEGYLRALVDGGSEVREHLLKIYPSISDPVLARYARNVLDAFSPAQESSLVSSGTSVPADGSSLSEREVQVLRLLSLGMSNQEIAAQLVISLATTKTHLRHIFEKLDAQNRVDAINRAKASGLI